MAQRLICRPHLRLPRLANPLANPRANPLAKPLAKPPYSTAVTETASLSLSSSAAPRSSLGPSRAATSPEPSAKMPPAQLATPIFRQLFDRESCTYTYLLADPASKRAILIDPVDTLIERDLQLLQEHGLTLAYAANTHAHADHISASGLLKQRVAGARSVIGASTGAKADVHVAQNDEIRVADDWCLSVIETPGHTDGCVSYFLKGDEQRPGMVFTGDALFVRGCGRTDFQGGDAAKLFHSVRDRLFALPEDTLVYPAHDYRGRTVSTIAEEKKFNPRLKTDNSLNDFVDIMANLQLQYPKMMDVAVPANLNCGFPPPE